MNLNNTNISICRVCMEESETLHSIFALERFLERTLQINEVIATCASVQVEIDDGLPQDICSNCLKKLIDAYAFKSLCEQTDITLRNNLRVKLEREDVFVKDEQVTIEDSATLGFMENFVNNTNETQKDIKEEMVISSKENEIKKPKKKYECKMCGKLLGSKRSLSIHGNSHLNIKPFMCDTCGKRCSNKHDLEKHRRIHSGEKPYMCEMCSKCFTTNSNMHKHLKHVHGPVKLLPCSMCRKYFPDTTSLEQHRGTHTTADISYFCDQCGVGFYQQRRLRNHMKSHTGEKPRGCLICGRHFRDGYNLRQHMKIHTGEKTFGCDVCGKLFAVNTALTKHKKTHASKKLKKTC